VTGVKHSVASNQIEKTADEFISSAVFDLLKSDFIEPQ